jgi:integrase
MVQPSVLAALLLGLVSQRIGDGKRRRRQIDSTDGDGSQIRLRAGVPVCGRGRGHCISSRRQGSRFDPLSILLTTNIESARRPFVVRRAGRKGGIFMCQPVAELPAQLPDPVVKRCASNAGIDHLAPHDLRRSCARLCHESGGELEQIQFLLGHSSVQTTERYLGSKQKLREAVNDRFQISVTKRA